MRLIIKIYQTQDVDINDRRALDRLGQSQFQNLEILAILEG
jgi:hypothetical protein